MLKKLYKLLIKLIVLVIVIGLIFILGIYFLTPSKYNILVIGSDQREGLHETDVSVKRGRSDVLMVLSVPKKGKDEISILMIPRDTYIDDEEYGDQKITHYYAMGERYESDVLGNLPLTEEKVEGLLDEKMDATFEVTFAGFAEIIDNIGGVETSEGHVDSDEAIELVHNRFVEARGDFGRASKQREILKGVLQKAKDMDTAKMLYNYVSDSEEVRLKYGKLKALCFGFSYMFGHGGSLDIGEIEEIELPGEGTRINGIYYWLSDEEAVQQTVKDYLK